MRMAFGRAALVAAAGILFFGVTVDRLVAAPAADEAAVETSADPGEPLALTKSKTPRVHQAAKSRKAAKVAAAKSAKRPAPAKVAAAKSTSKNTSNSTSKSAVPAAISETVANANAQMPSTDAQGGAAAIDITPAPLEAAAADQLTELDKSLASAPVEQPQQIAQLAQSVPPSSLIQVPASASPEPATPTRVTASSGGSSDAWAQSSLIGKIFIAFGGMLTLASAARMMVA